MSQYRSPYPVNPSIPTGGGGYHSSTAAGSQIPVENVTNSFDKMMLGKTNQAPPTTYNHAPPTSIMGPPPTSANPPPTSSLMGAPPTSLRGLTPGPPPSSIMGAPPTSIRGPSGTSYRGPVPPTAYGAPPTSLRGPTPGIGLAGPPPPTGSHMTGPPPTGSHMTGPPLTGSHMTGPPPTGGLMTGPPPTGSHMTGPPPTGSHMTGPPPTGGHMTGPPPTGSHMTGPPPTGGHMTGPPPTGSHMTGPPPTGSHMTGPPPTGSHMTGPPPTGGHMTGPPPTGSHMTGPPPTGGHMTGPPPTGSHMTGPPPTGSHMTGPPPTGSHMTGPPPTGGHMTGPPPTGSHMTGPPPTGSHMTGPPPTSSHMTAPPGQKYPHAGLSGTQMSGLVQTGPTSQAPPQQFLPALQPVNIQEARNILPTTPIQYTPPLLPGHIRNYNPDPAVFCSTMSTVPATSSLLNKMKLPFAIHIHPFKDSKAKACPVINPSVIVRCRVCRAYINPFVSFVDTRHWRCNFCFRNNTVPENYDFNPQSGKSGDHSFHHELRHATVEYIAPSEYMVRPPQPCVYFFVIDVTYPTIQSGLLEVFCSTLLDVISKLPGDGRTMVGFLSFDHTLHFYNLKPNQAQPQMLIVSDLDDPFIPSPTSLLVNLRESKELIKSFLQDFPSMFANQRNIQSGLGSALQVAEKLLHPIGGRVTVLMSSLPNIGPGSLKPKETVGATKMDQLNMSASTDFYKKLALDCSAQQIAVDLFVFSNKTQSLDLATVSTVAKYSSGQIKHYQNFHSSRPLVRERVEKDFRRYFTRNIGFEAVMRIRCTEGLSLHTFHGNFFVRSTDLLSLPNVNPDHAYCMNMAIDESLQDYPMVCIQAALLYTSYRGERRIRVHTLCLPVSDQLGQIYAGLNIVPITGVLIKMGADRVNTASLGDARDALINTIIDATKSYRSNQSISVQSSSKFSLPVSVRLLPLFVFGLLKNAALSLNSSHTVDSRADHINIIFTLPLEQLALYCYPRLYSLHTLSEEDIIDEDGVEMVAPPILPLTAAKLSRNGVFLMDYGLGIYIWVGKDISQETASSIFGVPHFGAIPEFMTSLPLLDNPLNRLVNMFIHQIRLSRQHFMPLVVIREDGPHRLLFINYLMDDKTEDGTSYYEFISHLSKQISK